MIKTKMTVAQFLTIKIDESGKTQKEIATEIGYDAANLITMFKQGLTKLPLNTVGPIARALDVDPVYLLRLAFNEYFPETFEAVEHALGTTFITENERKLVELYRSYTNNEDPEMVMFGPPRALAVVLAD
jgi:hypothetical protein